MKSAEKNLLNKTHEETPTKEIPLEEKSEVKTQKPKLLNIKTEKLHPFENHPYKILDDDSMAELKESIKEYGLLNRILVRPLDKKEEEYEVISGHRRVYAAKALGIKELPAIVHFIDRDEATLLMVDSNNQRERLLPSEKAFAYRMKYEALKHQGKTSSQLGTKLRTDEKIAKENGESRNQIQRYIRLTYLIPKLLEMMDEGKIAFSVGVELSYLDEQSQQTVLDACEQNDCTPSYSQSYHLHRAMNEGELDQYFIFDLLGHEKANQRETMKIPMERLKGKFPENYTYKQAEDFVLKAVDHYAGYLKAHREQSR